MVKMYHLATSPPETSSPMSRSQAWSDTDASESGAMGIRMHCSRPREIEILLACARLKLQDDGIQRIRESIVQGPDWHRLISLSLYHRLTAFLYMHLSSVAPELVPDEVLNLLRSHYVTFGSRALRQTAELLEVLDLLNKNAVLAVPYKGPDLATRIYQNLALRYYSDLDLIVKQQDVPAARLLLESAGFRPKHPTSRAAQQFLVRNRHSDIFMRADGSAIELHWAFVDGETSFPVRLEDLQSRLQEAEIGGYRVRVFAPEDLLLILCVHGATHRWDRLEWLCGLAELIRQADLDWSDVLARANEQRIDKTLLLGLLLAHDLLDAPVLDRILLRARADRDVAYLSRVVGDELDAGIIQIASQNSLQRDLFRFRLQSTASDRLRYFLRRFTTPGRRGDTRYMLPLGRWSVPLPAFVRPLRVIAKVIQESIAQRASQNRYPKS